MSIVDSHILHLTTVNNPPKLAFCYNNYKAKAIGDSRGDSISLGISQGDSRGDLMDSSLIDPPYVLHHLLDSCAHGAMAGISGST